MSALLRNSPSMKPLRGINPPHAMLDRQHSMIAEAAYYLSEQRGFAPGHELDDWLAAENQIGAALDLGATPTLDGRC